MKPPKSITEKQFSKRLERDVIQWKMNYEGLLRGCRRDVNDQPTPVVQAALDDMAAYIASVKWLEHRRNLGEEPNGLVMEWAQLRRSHGVDRPQFAIGKWRVPIPHREPTAIVVVAGRAEDLWSGVSAQVRRRTRRVR